MGLVVDVPVEAMRLLLCPEVVVMKVVMVMMVVMVIVVVEEFLGLLGLGLELKEIEIEAVVVVMMEMAVMDSVVTRQVKVIQALVLPSLVLEMELELQLDCPLVLEQPFFHFSDESQLLPLRVLLVLARRDVL